MAVQTNDEITKTELINNFKNNLLVVMFSGLNSTNNPVYFSGTRETFTNPLAINTNQLESSTQPEITIPDEEISAAGTYAALKSIVDSLTKIRRYTSTWYHSDHGTLGRVDGKEGTAIFKDTIPALTTFNKSTRTSGANGWERTVNGASGTTAQNVTLTKTLTVTNPFVVDDEIQASQVTPYTLDDTLFNNLFEAWDAVRNEKITYTYYTCHSNWGNWTNVRSRR